MEATIAMIPKVFDQPHRLTFHELAALDELHRQIAVAMESELAAFLHAPVRLSLHDAEQLPYAALSKTLPPLTCFALLSDSILINLDETAALAAINLLLGNDGKLPPTFHNPTSMEMAILRKLFQKITATLNNCWSLFNIPSLQLETTSHSSLPDLPSSSTAAIFRFNLDILNLKGLLTLAYPLNWLNKFHIDSPTNTSLSPNLDSVSVDITVRLAHTTLQHSDLDSLRPGDIIKMDQSFHSPADVRVHDNTILKGTPCLQGKYKAVSLSKPH